MVHDVADRMHCSLRKDDHEIRCWDKGCWHLSDCRNYLQTIEVVGFRLMHTIHCSRGKDFGRSLKFDRQEEIEPCPSLLLDGSCLCAGVMPLDRGVLSVASSEDNAKSRSSCEAPGLVCRSL